MASMVQTLSVFQTTVSTQFSNEFVQSINDTASDQTYLGTSVQTTASSQIGVGDFITGLFLFIQIFFTSIALPFQLLTSFGVPAGMALYLSFPIYLLYLISIVQFISGRYFE